MFCQLDDHKDPVTITVDGADVAVGPTCTVAAALLVYGAEVLCATPVGSTARSPFCLMGVWNDSLVESDGQPDQLACQVRVRDGMVIARQRDGVPMTEFCDVVVIGASPAGYVGHHLSCRAWPIGRRLR